MDLLQLEEMMVSQNPQWRKQEPDMNKLKLKRELFSKLYDFLDINRLVGVINGPRRIGKTFLLKQLIAKLNIDQPKLAKNTLYFSFSTAMDERDIIIKLVGIFLSKYADQKEKMYIFLDEVQYLSYWQDQIKQLYDQELPIKFILTGSTSLFYGAKSKESLMGRIEKFNLLPLSFGEYLEFRGISKPSLDRGDFVSRLPIFRSEFRKYLAYGQLPEVAINSGIEPTKYLMDMVDTLVNFDVPYLYAKLDRTMFLNLVKSLSFSIANEFSLSKTAKGLESDRQTVTAYLQILQEIGLFSPCLNSYYKSMRARLSASKKIYTTNTNLTLAVNGFDGSYLNDSRILGQYAENYVHLRLKEKYGMNIEYFSDKHREVDFVTHDTIWEVKYGAAGNLDKYVELSQRLKKPLTVITENEMSDGEVKKLPIYLL